MFAVGGQTVGYLSEEVAGMLLRHCRNEEDWEFFISQDQKSWKSVQKPPHPLETLDSMREVAERTVANKRGSSVKISLRGPNAGSRSTTLAKLLDTWRKDGHLRVLGGWRNELYPIYGARKELLCNVERAASSLFGIVTYGVHMTVYVQNHNEIKIWVPRRAATKQTWPGKLDNSVAGGITSGEQPFASLIREAAEEASLPENLVRKGAKSCGIVSYYFLGDPIVENGRQLDQPECEYVYDLEVDESTTLKPSDSEVESFKLMTVEEVQKAMHQGEFKPNCALVLLDFFIRHGILTAENEPDYFEICTRLHRPMPFPTI